MSSFSTPSPEKYDCFINFRGQDTRNGFTSHLHRELEKAGIKAYIDDDIYKSSDVWAALSQAIRNSRLAILVFSAHYASSSWCLKELVEILKCRREQAQVVVPVFYDVEPADVRWRLGTYREDLETLKEHYSDMLPAWEDALNEAANASGWATRSRECKNDSEYITKIVEDISKKLELMSSYELDAKDLFGVDRICKGVISLLSKNKKNISEYKNVQIIGISGIGGIGKSVIAKAVYFQFYAQYDSFCFLDNIRVEVESEPNKLGSLFGQLLYELIKVHIGSSFPKAEHYMKRLSEKKVLIVLDDVDSVEQIEELSRVCKFAGKGSKLIITTRKGDLLHGRVDEIYKVRKWRDEDSMEYFCMRAFHKREPEKGFELLSERAIKYSRGVPIALKALADTFYKRCPAFWDGELIKLEKEKDLYPAKSVQKILEFCFAELDEVQKKMSLDIASFFQGENKDFVSRILDAIYNPDGINQSTINSGMQILKERGLINITMSQKVHMPDMIQEMGLKIAREKDEFRGSRLRSFEEVKHVLANKKGNEKVEGIKLNMSQINILRLKPDAFDKMTRLKFLKLYGKSSGVVKYPEILNKISDELRYLEWNQCGFKYLPATFNAKLLFEIHMPHSNLIELWRGKQDLKNLMRIVLNGCKNLKKLPDLSGASNLKWVDLSDCENLRKFDAPFSARDTLETLILDGCKKLGSLFIRDLKSLKRIGLAGCLGLKQVELPPSEIISSLDLSNARIEELSSIGELRNLGWLILDASRLKNLPKELASLNSLKWLKVTNFNPVIEKEEIPYMFEGLTKLAELSFLGCVGMHKLPDNINELTSLKKLKLNGSGVKTLPENIKQLWGLESLSLKNCNEICSLPELPRNIVKLKAVNCKKLEKISTLTTFAGWMPGNSVFFSFQNSTRCPDESILTNVQLSMMAAAFHSVRSGQEAASDYYYPGHVEKYVHACFPRKTVPENFTRGTTSSSGTITISSDRYISMVFCVVLSPDGLMTKQHGGKVSLFCDLRLASSTFPKVLRWRGQKSISDLNYDHVFMWIHRLDYYFEEEVSFEFYLKDGEKKPEHPRIKECGVRQMLYSELPGLLSELHKHSDPYAVAQDLDLQLRDLQLSSQ